jgi:toxin-antitoxin system PIN domain toxin
VIVPDANLLIYAVDDTSPRHERARRWLAGVLGGGETVGFAWTVLLAFVRLTTRAGVSARPLAAEQAFELVEAWLASPLATIVHPTGRHLAVLRGLLEPLGTAGNLVGDAHLAALAIEHGATLASSDTDFVRFRGLRWIDPLAGAA